MWIKTCLLFIYLVLALFIVIPPSLEGAEEGDAHAQYFQYWHIGSQLHLSDELFISEASYDRSGEQEVHKSSCRDNEYLDVTIGKRDVYYSSGRFRGGEITDGADVRQVSWFKLDNIERIEISIYDWEEISVRTARNRVSYFELESALYPDSFRVLFFGVRAFTAYENLGELNESFGQSTLIHSIFPIIMLDDSAYSIGIVFKKPVEFEVYELKNPGKIVIDLSMIDERAPSKEIYSLRTLSKLPFSETTEYVRLAVEEASDQPTRYLADVNGDYLLEVGQYMTREEAAAQKENIMLNGPSIKLVIEKRRQTDLPRKILD